MIKTMLKTHIVIWVKIKKSLIKKDVVYKGYRSKKTVSVDKRLYRNEEKD